MIHCHHRRISPTPTLRLLGLILGLASTLLARLPGDAAAVGPRNQDVLFADYAEVRYVAPVTESGDGSRDKPWSSVAEAVAQVVAYPGHRVAVLVATGTYDDKTITMREQVDLFGGYSAGSWQRDIFAHPTVLDGRDARRVVIGASHARLDGFVIRHGRASGHGGALLCDGTSPTVSNNRFEANSTLEPEGFRADRIHQEGHRGGAMACLYEAMPLITNNLFIGNWTEIGDGGALAFFGRSEAREKPGTPKARVENNVFVDNRTGIKDFGPARASSGGAMVVSHETSPIIRNNVVAHNRALGNSDAGGIYNEFICSPTIENNWIVGNEATDDGGGIYTMRLGEPLIRHNLIAGNWSDNGGVGGVRVSKEGRARVVDNQIVRNQSGGGVLVVDGYLIAERNLIADNLAPKAPGAGIGVRQTFGYFASVQLTDNIVRNNAGGGITVYKNVGVPPVLKGNQIQEGAPATDAPSLVITGATFDAAHGQTLIQVRAATGVAQPAAGQVVWRGTRWSVVASSQPDAINVWGDLSAADSGPALHLLPDYQ